MARRKRQKNRKRNQRRGNQKQTEQSAPQPATVTNRVDQEVATQPEATAATQQNDWQPERSAWRSLDLWQAIFSGCLVVCAIAATWYGHLQWDATEKQYSAMERQLAQMAADQRPWVVILHPQLSEPPMAREALIGCYFKNYGQRPSLISGHSGMLAAFSPDGDFPPSALGSVRMRGTELVYDLQINRVIAELEKRETRGNSVILPPGESAEFSERILQSPEGQAIDEWFREESNRVIMFFFIVKYSDVSDAAKVRTTRQFFVYDRPSKRFIPCPSYDAMD
ncbi:MAG TPA: hypothetical protein VG713_05700 [Pirellulales bacterium]|nr:hypothetical protein [Pirellulales bacterium]